MSETSTPLFSHLTHIGVVVQDVRKTTNLLSSLWGVGPWTIFEASTSREDMLIGEPFRLVVGQASLGTSMLEIIEPVGDGSLWANFLRDKGEGLHHLAYSTPKWNEVTAALKARGSRMVVLGNVGGQRFAYFEATEPGGLMLELGEEV
jgi:methylmalonyl-CoA/ethylmalonyl-CoA epimerase